MRIYSIRIRCDYSVSVQFCTFTGLFAFLYFYVSLECFDYLLDVDFISFEYFRIRSVFGYHVSNHLSYIIAFNALRVLSVMRSQVYWKLPRKHDVH